MRVVLFHSFLRDVQFFFRAISEPTMIWWIFKTRVIKETRFPFARVLNTLCAGGGGVLNVIFGRMAGFFVLMK